MAAATRGEGCVIVVIPLHVPYTAGQIPPICAQTVTSAYMQQIWWLLVMSVCGFVRPASVPLQPFFARQMLPRSVPPATLTSILSTPWCAVTTMSQSCPFQVAIILFFTQNINYTPGTLYGPPAVDTIGDGSMMMGGPAGESMEDYQFLRLTQDADDMTTDEEDEDEAASWLLLNPPVKNNKSNIKNNNNNQNNNYGMLFGGEVVDDYLDLAEYGGDSQFNDQYSVNQQQQLFSVPQKSYGGDSVVPIQDGQGKSPILYHQQQQQQSHNLNFVLGMKYDNSNTRYGYHATMSHSVSISSMDVSVVPESALNETSNSHPQPPKGNIDLFSGPPIQISPQLTPMDRGARVLRYREKRKNRKFDKTIRYASRKVYAETRPRIKGRFAKRTDIAEVDQMFSTQLIADSSYGIVPS